jgi:hypothetical protein
MTAATTDQSPRERIREWVREQIENEPTLSIPNLTDRATAPPGPSHRIPPPERLPKNEGDAP